MNAEELLSIPKEDLGKAAQTLSADDVPLLVVWLNEKDDKLRYPSLLMLQYRAEFSPDSSPYWDEYVQKLVNENSYQRSIGLLMIACNAKWVDAQTMDEAIGQYLVLLHDEKPITIRQCVQGLLKIVPYHKELHGRIAKSLLALDLNMIKETMRKSILLDILHVLILLRKQYKNDDVEQYITKALSGGMLDAKAKKEIQSALLETN